MNRRQFSLVALSALALGSSNRVGAKSQAEDDAFAENFGSAEFWNEHRVTLGDSREKFDEAFGEAFLKEDNLGVRYRFRDGMSISVDICPQTNEADTIFITPYDYYRQSRRNDKEPRFTREQADMIVRLMTPIDHENKRRLLDPMFGKGVIGTSKLLEQSINPATYEWVDNSPSIGNYTVWTYWSFFGDGPTLRNPGGREENIELIILTLNVE